jgi:glycosyltransferase involved in cell wall biosynthesis
VAAAVGGLGELIEDGLSGILVRGRSPDDFARAALRLLEDDRLREGIVAAARARVRGLFSEERMLRGIAAVYRSLAAGDAGG